MESREWSPRLGFTLIEVLITISIIAVLVGIVLPSLASTRITARQALSQSHARSIGQQFTMYQGAWRDAYPFMNAGQLVPIGNGVSLASSKHWDVAYLWPGLVLSEMGTGDPPEWLLSPSRRMGDYQGRTSYFYSNSFVARPELWNQAVAASMTMKRVVSSGDVTSPSRKVLLFDADVTYRSNPLRVVGGDLDEPVPAQFADQHGDVVRPSNASGPVTNRLDPDHPLASRRLHNTVNGVRGVDY